MMTDICTAHPSAILSCIQLCIIATQYNMVWSGEVEGEEVHVLTAAVTGRGRSAVCEDNSLDLTYRSDKNYRIAIA
jgi:hypothetical protein